jgi:hypothetical protein
MTICFVGRIWKKLEKKAKETLRRCKYILMSKSGRTSEDPNADMNADSKNYLYEVWMEMRTALGIKLEAIPILF